MGNWAGVGEKERKKSLNSQRDGSVGHTQSDPSQAVTLVGSDTSSISGVLKR